MSIPVEQIVTLPDQSYQDGEITTMTTETYAETYSGMG